MDGLSESSYTRSSEHEEVLLQELDQTKEEVMDMIHKLDDMRHNFKNDTEEISHKLRERSDVYTRLENKLSLLPEMYGREIEEIVALQQEKKERISYQNNDRLLQITERLRMLETKVSGIEIQKERDGEDSGDIGVIHSRDLVIKSISGLIYLLIIIFHALFFLLSIAQRIVKPFILSSSRIILSSVIFISFGIMYLCRDNLMFLHFS